MNAQVTYVWQYWHYQFLSHCCHVSLSRYCIGEYANRVSRLRRRPWQWSNQALLHRGRVHDGSTDKADAVCLSVLRRSEPPQADALSSLPIPRRLRQPEDKALAVVVSLALHFTCLQRVRGYLVGGRSAGVLAVATASGSRMPPVQWVDGRKTPNCGEQTRASTSPLGCCPRYTTTISSYL